MSVIASVLGGATGILAATAGGALLGAFGQGRAHAPAVVETSFCPPLPALSRRLSAAVGEAERCEAALQGKLEALRRAKTAASGPDSALEVADPAAARKRAVEKLAVSWLQGLMPEKFAGMTPEKVRYLRDLNLDPYGMGGYEATDEDLRNLAAFGSLRELRLRETRITDEGLAHLKDLASLRSLELRGTRLTDAGMDRLKDLPLVDLDLNKVAVTDAGLSKLKDMQTLRFLRLNSTKVTDAGLAEVATLGSLERLDLWGLPITDAGAERLMGMTSLKRLELGGTKVSQEWVRRFQSAHPGCEVVR